MGGMYIFVTMTDIAYAILQQIERCGNEAEFEAAKMACEDYYESSNDYASFEWLISRLAEKMVELDLL